jgi:ADP-heptose:LPS heptosyltransferase
VRRLAKSIALRGADRIARAWRPRSATFTRPDAFYVMMLRPLGLGDIAMLSPFVEALADVANGAPVYLVTEHEPFLRLERARWIHPDDVRERRLATALVISPTLSWRHLRWLRHANQYIGYFLSNRLISSFPVPEGRYDPRTDHYFDRVRPILAALGASPEHIRYPEVLENGDDPAELPPAYICVAPFSNWPERQYPADRFRHVVSKLTAELPVVLVGGNAPDERATAEAIRAGLPEARVVNLVGRTSLHEVAHVIRRARLFVGNDAGLTHIAFLSRIPVLGIFGCVPAALRVPNEPERMTRIETLGAGARCPSFPCYDGFSRPRCGNAERFLCLTGVETDAVVSAAGRLLRAHASR